MLDAAQKHLSMFATAAMLASLVAFLLSTGPAFGTGRGLPASDRMIAATQSEGEAPLLDIGNPMSIEKEIVATPLGDDIVSYDVAIHNHSPVDALRLDTLDDAELGNLDGRGSCSVPQVVQAGATYRCSFLERVGSSG
jgi:hypothetical protein